MSDEIIKYQLSKILYHLKRIKSELGDNTIMIDDKNGTYMNGKTLDDSITTTAAAIDSVILNPSEFDNWRQRHLYN